MAKSFLLIDGNNLAWRAYYAIGRLTYKSFRTEIIYGFLKDIFYLQRRLQEDNLIFCFDKGESLRKQQYPPYKANREVKLLNQKNVPLPPGSTDKECYVQIDALRKEVLPAMGFRNVFAWQGSEADDLIAAICQDRKKDKITIVSSDKDLYQCLTPRVSIWEPRKAKLITDLTFTKEYEIKPEQWWIVKALSGCRSDNVKGISGVGDKIALTYLKGGLRNGMRLNNILQHMSEILKQNTPIVKLPFPGTPVPKIVEDEGLDEEGKRRILKKYNLHSLDSSFFPKSKRLARSSD